MNSFNDNNSRLSSGGNGSEQNAKKNYYKNFLSNIINLPPIPATMEKVIQILDDPSTSASDLGNVINHDQALAAKILAVANSPLYGIPKKVSTIEFAIVILGFDHIKNIVIALSLMEAFNPKNDKRWNKQHYWQHSFLTACMAKRIAEDLGYHKSGEAFTGGLLHDLGISVIKKYFDKQYNEICDTAEKENITYMEAEHKVMDTNHQEIGKLLADNWNLPPALAETISCHHYPANAELNPVLTSIVHLADFITERYQIGNFEWDKNIELDKEIIKLLNLGDDEYLVRFMDTYLDILKQQVESLNF